MIQLIVLYAVFTAVTSIITVDDGWCGNRNYSCADRQCIYTYELCDGTMDCFDGTDESICEGFNVILEKNHGECYYWGKTSTNGTVEDCNFTTNGVYPEKHSLFLNDVIFEYDNYYFEFPQTITMWRITVHTSVLELPPRNDHRKICTKVRLVYSLNGKPGGRFTRRLKYGPPNTRQRITLKYRELKSFGMPVADAITVKCIKVLSRPRGYTFLDEVQIFNLGLCTFPTNMHGLWWVKDVARNPIQGSSLYRIISLLNEKNVKIDTLEPTVQTLVSEHVCLRWKFYPLRSRHFYYIRRDKQNKSKVDCAMLHLNDQETLLLHKQFTADDPTKITLDDCVYGKYDPAVIYVRYPYELSQRVCPFPYERYQVVIFDYEIRVGEEIATYCLNDSSSFVTVQHNGVMNFRTCVKVDTNYKPFNSIFNCKGHLNTTLLGSPEENGKLVVLERHGSYGFINFYTARYNITENQQILMSLEGYIQENLQPVPEHTFTSVNFSPDTFNIGFLLTPSCFSLGCDNGGVCINETCVCVVGFTGIFCETDINDCQGETCSNRGSCKDLVNDYECECFSKTTIGKNCEKEIHCHSSPCEYGRCEEVEGGFVCNCQMDHGGERCEKTLNCVSCPCQFGTCEESLGGFLCRCITGYTGVFCEQVVFSVSIEGYNGQLRAGSDLAILCRPNEILENIEFAWVFTRFDAGESVIVSTSPVYVKLNVAETHAGKYECQARSEIYEGRATITVDVIAASQAPQAQKQQSDSSIVTALAIFVVVLLVIIAVLAVLAVNLKQKINSQIDCLLRQQFPPEPQTAADLPYRAMTAIDGGTYEE